MFLLFRGMDRLLPMTKKMADVLSELMSRRGYARVQAHGRLCRCLAQGGRRTDSRYTRAGVVRRGVLEVLVANSTLVQEITFQKQAILEKLAGLLPDERIDDLRSESARSNNRESLCMIEDNAILSGHL